MESIWHRDFKDWQFPKVNNNLETKILIIGGGITGLIAAYELKRNRKSFILVDAKKLGRAVTANTTAQISIAHDQLPDEIKKKHGTKKAIEYLKDQVNGLNYLKEIIEKEQINCDHKYEKTLLGANVTKNIKKLESIYELLKIADIPAKMIYYKDKLFTFLSALEFDNQLIINPIKYINGLINVLKNNELYEDSQVTDIIQTEDGYEVVINNKYKIKTEKIIMACHYPFTLNNFYFTKLYQSTSYAIAFKTKVKLKANYLSLDKPYYYLRTYDKNTLIIGGSDHYTGANQDIYHCYHDLAKKIYQIDSKAKVIYQWFNEDTMPLNYLPYVGHYSKDHPNIILMTGWQKWGFTNSHAAALKLTKLLNNKDYCPENLALTKNCLNYLRMVCHSVNGLVVSKLLIKSENLKNIKIESGKPIRYKGKNILVYRISENRYIFLKNKCTHMGCSLIWDDVDKLWISRCHGTVYDKFGKVIYGPGLKDLKKINS